MNYKPEIIYEDREIIVSRKPAGIPTQSSRVGTQDMVSILKNHLAAGTGADQATFSPDSRRQRAPYLAPYLALIHRLDQPVEGLLVFAKTPAAAKDLNRQLGTSAFGKYYIALISGIPSPREGTLEDYLIKDRSANISRVCTENTPGAKLARLHYRVTGIREGNAVTEIQLDTGRHHQIRVQMSHFGHPLAGDRKYGSTLPAAQLNLCAWKLQFLHPVDHRPMDFTTSPSFL